MKTGYTLARLAALCVALAPGLVSSVEPIRDCDRPNHYILSKCEDELRLEWVPVPDTLLAHGRGHSATLLLDGRVLVVGGGKWRYDEAARMSTADPVGAELYEPGARTWSLTAPMNLPRMPGAHAVRLLDGRVLVLGGETPFQDAESSAEIFDPPMGTWTRTASLIIPRVAFTATLLAHGEVLVVGGVSVGRGYQPVAVAEIYNPESGTWRTTGSLHDARWGHTATILPNGKVLVAGGVLDDWIHEAAATAELFDPETETWSQAGRIVQGSWHTATSLGDGRVLVAGGTQHECPGGPCSENNVESTRLYDPGSGNWMDTGTLISPRFDHLAVPMPGQGVLLVGGWVGVTPVPHYSVAPVERLALFDLWTWKEVAAVNELPTSANNYYSATPLADGTVLFIGDVEGKRAVQLRH